MRSELTPDEVDTVMANIHLGRRFWCWIGCGPPPGESAPEIGCACSGCLNGALSWDEWIAWQEREKHREPTPYIETGEMAAILGPLTLEQRLAGYKHRKRSANSTAE